MPGHRGIGVPMFEQMARAVPCRLVIEPHKTARKAAAFRKIFIQVIFM
jgi:hypothetical protein